MKKPTRTSPAEAVEGKTTEIGPDTQLQMSDETQTDSPGLRPGKSQFPNYRSPVWGLLAMLKKTSNHNSTETSYEARVPKNDSTSACAQCHVPLNPMPCTNNSHKTVRSAGNQRQDLRRSQEQRLRSEGAERHRRWETVWSRRAVVCATSSKQGIAQEVSRVSELP